MTTRDTLPAVRTQVAGSVAGVSVILWAAMVCYAKRRGLLHEVV